MSQLQPSYETRVNRFPRMFARALSLRPNAKRILSFGCSSGEECFTLADLFPNSEIVGVDLQQYLLTKARNNNKFEDRVFFHDELGGTGTYDIVFCMMVLFCIANPISKEMFEKILTKIERHVNPDGLMVIYTAEYDPMEVRAFSDSFRVLRGWKHAHNLNKKEYFDGYYIKNTEAKSWKRWILG